MAPEIREHPVFLDIAKKYFFRKMRFCEKVFFGFLTFWGEFDFSHKPLLRPPPRTGCHSECAFYFRQMPKLSDPSSYRQPFQARWGIDAAALDLFNDARVDIWKSFWGSESRK